MTECCTAKKFNHPNVMSMIGVCISADNDLPLMILPYMLHGDVKTFLKSKRGNDIVLDKFPKVFLMII